MGDPVREIANDPLAIEGLEEVFDTSEAELFFEDRSSEVFGTPHDTSSEVFGTAREILTTNEAAIRLGISSRAVINRLKAGTLPGARIRGRFKEEWRVYWEDLPNSSEEIPVDTVTASEASEAESSKDSKEYSTSEPSHGQQFLSDLLSAHVEQTKAQSELIRYLAEQLKEKDQQIKLLTDSQHNAGWWSRFSGWFLGKPNTGQDK